MKKEIIKDCLNDIATQTGISYSGDQTISESIFEKLVNYVDKLEQQVQKQKEVINKVIKTLEIQIEAIKDQPSDNAWYDHCEINQRNMCIKLLKEASE